MTEGRSILNFVTCSNLLDHYGHSDHCSSHWVLGQITEFCIGDLEEGETFFLSMSNVVA